MNGGDLNNKLASGTGSRAAAWWFQISYIPGSSNIAVAAGKWGPRMKSRCIEPIKTGDIPLVC